MPRISGAEPKPSDDPKVHHLVDWNVKSAPPAHHVAKSTGLDASDVSPVASVSMSDGTPPTSPGDLTTGAPLRPRFGRLAGIFLVLVVGGLFTITALQSRADVADPGTIPRGALARQSAPDISIGLLDGTVFSMSEHFATDGRPLVMNLWASWCIPCREEMPDFDAVARANPDVAFVGFAVDDQTVAAREFAAEINVSYPLGIDSERAIAAVYPYIGLPTTYIIDADGIVTRQIQGQVSQAQLQAYLEFDLS